MPRLDTLAYYKECFDSIELLETQRVERVKPNGEKYRLTLNWPKMTDEALRLILAGKSMYIASEAATGVPWIFIACLHYRERSCNFTGQLLNGEPYRFKTLKVPAGFGPWTDWPSSTRFAMQHYKMNFPEWKIPHLVVPMMLKQWEKWNGMAYFRMGKHSPYNMSGCNHGLGVGKYVADGKYDPNAVDMQVGCAVLLKVAMERGIYAI